MAERKKVKVSCVWLFVTPWTVACQSPLSMEFSRQEYWSGKLFPSPGDLPNPGIEPRSPTLLADSFPSEVPGFLSCSKVFWLNLGPIAKMQWAESLPRTPSSLLPEIGEFHLWCPSAPCKWIWMICLPLLSVQSWVHKGMGRGHDCCSTSCIKNWNVLYWGHITGQESEAPEKKLAPREGSVWTYELDAAPSSLICQKKVGIQTWGAPLN